MKASKIHTEKKILKQVEYESARRKRYNNEKQEKEMRKALHFFMYIYLGNSKFFKGRARRSNRRKKLRQRTKKLRKSPKNSGQNH